MNELDPDGRLEADHRTPAGEGPASGTGHGGGAVAHGAAGASGSARGRGLGAFDRRGRVLGLLIVAGGLVTMGTLTDPQPAPASEIQGGGEMAGEEMAGGGEVAAHAAGFDTADAEEAARVGRIGSRPVLVELIGREHRVRIHAGESGGRCTLLTAGGEVLARGLTMREVAERAPAFSLDRLHAAAGDERDGGDGAREGTMLMHTPTNRPVPGVDN